MWKQLAALVLLAAAVVPAADRKAAKPAELEVVASSVVRQESVLQIDVRVRSQALKPIKRIVFLVDILDSGNQVLTTQRAKGDEETIEPGQECELHAQLPAPARATAYRLNFEDGGGRDLRAADSGPFPIE